MAFVLVQHLDPKRESMLREILARSTPMPVREVRNGMTVERNSVYVVPATGDIGLIDGSFQVVARKRVGGREMPIDAFFRSLAESYMGLAIGVVLSGTLSDGALGLRAIKAEGGVTFAQEEGSAKFPDMPRAAIAAGSVDFVFPPEKIAQELARIGKHPYARSTVVAAAEQGVAHGSDHQRILSILRSTTGVDFSHYRQTTVKRRISRRMALRKVDSVKKYVELLRREPSEIHGLYEDILITVTGFFRDPEVFQSLKSLVFPALLKERGLNNPVRIWIPGCATGEEVYSIAICLFEALRDLDVNPSIQIFATDVSDTAIDKARTGIYLENALVDVSPERLKRFFVKSENGWQISKTIRDVCVFARQNVIADPPFSNLDMISCRNLLIYLEPILQKRVLPLFHYALKSNGFLVLGSAETITGFGELFDPLDRNHRVFVKRAGSPRQIVDFTRHRMDAEVQEPEAPAAASPIAGPLDLQREADRLVLGRYGPPGVLINDAFEILQFRGRTGPYLEAASGAASLNVLKMAREGLLVELRAAVLNARKTGRSYRREGIQVREDRHFREVNLEVVPVEGRGMPAHYLILFEESPAKAHTPHAVRPVRSGRRVASSGDHETIVKLEQELTSTKDYLQSIIEEHEAANEELKSANEEILSSNEELQSTNEELETAKEELQSTNEELTTVNEEMQNRNVELTQVNNDLVNLLSGTSLAVVMLGPDGRIRRFTTAARKLFHLIESDVGRKISDIKHRLQVGDLNELVAEVVANVSSKEREIQDDSGNWYLMHIRPYRTLDNRIEGAVIVFFDIDPLKRTLDQANRARSYAEALVETVREALVVLDGKLRVRTANEPFYRIFRATPLQTEGKSFFDLWNWENANPGLRNRLDGAASSEEPIEALELELELGGYRKNFVLNARRVNLPGEGHPLLLLAIEDATERKQAEQELRDSESRYRRIFETAREGIWLLDASTGEILDVNPYLVEMLGTSREELLGKKPWRIGILEDPDRMRASFANLRREGFAADPDLVMRDRSGDLMHIEAISSVYELDGRQIVQSNLRDITDRTRMQDQLRQVQKLDSIGTLAGGVAHDFNNLLNIISAQIAVLSKGKPAQPSFEAVQKAVERGSAVVKQLLTFARTTKASFAPTDVNAVVEEVASMVRETFPKDIELSVELEPEVPSIHGDFNQIHQAILNLAVNARDAMSKGGRLTLRTERVSSESLRRRHLEPKADQYVGVEVTDTGEGMAEETRRRAFEPFFTTKQASSGSGLGLAVVYGIVNSHHGLIDLESGVGKGTSFRLYFEVPREHDRPAEPRPGNGKRRAQRPDRLRARHSANGQALLLVEDEEMLLAPMKSLLEEEGFEILTARDGIEAIETYAANQERISAVVMDLGLPRMNGWDAFLRMRDRDPLVRCVIASGNIDAERRKQIEREGVRSLRKPYSQRELLEALRALLKAPGPEPPVH